MLRPAARRAATADEAAAGWDGGIYRAWTDGHAHGRGAGDRRGTPPTTRQAFADAMRAWLDATGERGFVGEPDGARVDVAFATSDEALQVLARSQA